MKDEDTRYEAVRSRDGRFDGEFFFAVGTTGIYCRPSCPAVTPKRENVRFYASAAAAQGAGFRACRRCRPDAAPGSAEWNVRADAVGRAMPLDAPHGTLTHLFPEPAALTGAAGPLGALATALAEGTARLDVGADRDDTEAALLALPGLDPRTVAAIRTRALGDPDVAPPDETLPDAWRPWRSYALQHLRTADDREPATATAARRQPRARTQTRTQTWTLAQAQAHAQESALGQGDQS